jgi:hypothetical protein
MICLRTAYDVKETIDQIQDFFDPIGVSISDIIKYNKNYFRTDDTDSIKKDYYIFNNNLINLKNKLTVTNIDFGNNIDFELNIKFYDLKINISQITPIIIKNLYDISKNSELLYDTDFYVDDTIITFIKFIWKTKFNKNVSVIPYKLNIYNTITSEWRTDVFSKNRIGTFLIGLYNNYDGGTMYIKNENENIEWDSVLQSWCSFYSDLPYKIMPIIYGYRTTIEFHIYQEENFDILPTISPTIINNYDFLKSISHYGILLSHKYNFNSDELQGSDKKIYDILLSLGASIDIIYVINKYHHITDNSDYNEYTEMYSRIYQFNDEYINYIIGKTNIKPINKYDNIDFYKFNDGYEWYYNFKKHLVNTPDDLQEEQDYIYIHRALIVTFLLN